MKMLLAIVVMVVAFIALGFKARGPGSLRASYERDVAQRVMQVEPAGAVRDQDLAHLPARVRSYLLRAGVIGRPRVYNFRVEMRGRIRSGPDARWMPLRVEQYSFMKEPARLFYMRASMFAIPVQGYHRYTATSASMNVKAAAVVPVVSATGREMHQAETVTMFNDMCLLAPASLIDPRITWEEISRNVCRATFSGGEHTITADLIFNDAGDLIDFSSDDRYRLSSDGKGFEKVRWSTPIGSYRTFGSVRLPSRGEARWHDAAGEYPYAQLVFDDITYNVGRR